MKVNIVGGGPSWIQTPNRNGELWAVSTVYERLLTRGYAVDKVFQLHGAHLFEPFIAPLQSKAVIMKPNKIAPKAMVLPANELLYIFGKRFSSTVTWMLAHAIYIGAEEIGIYGVDMLHAGEYAAQRDMFFYFCGFAAAKGIKITIPKFSGTEIKDSTYEYKE